MCSYRIGVHGPGHRPMVSECLKSGVGQGVDCVGSDEVVHVESVGVGRVLGRGGCPEGSLHLGSAFDEGSPSGAAEFPLEHVVGHLSLGDGRPAPQGQGLGGSKGVESAVHLAVGSTDEERGHRRHPREVTRTGLQAGEVGLHYLSVAV